MLGASMQVALWLSTQYTGGNMKLKHIISTKQFDRRILEEIFAVADRMADMDRKNACDTSLNCKIMASLFYEPSTRTRFSFEAGMMKLGGQVISTENASQFSSAAKGETLEDSIKVVSGFVDIIVLRHPEEGAAARAAKVSSVPIINGGDGKGEHPSQAAYDLYTILKEHKKVDGLHIGMVGDLLNGRTIHSLIHLLIMYPRIKLSFCAPQELALPETYRALLKKAEVVFKEYTDLQPMLGTVDVLYVTRIQKERFHSAQEYDRLKHIYVVDKKSLQKMKKKSIIMHPLPRVGEISQEVDADPRAAYFRQAQNGLYVRMALLEMLLNKK